MPAWRKLDPAAVAFNTNSGDKSHMIYAEAQDLDQALDILSMNARHPLGPRLRRKVNSAHRELQKPAKPPVSLPKLKCLERELED
jgi:hypothetical protein